MADCRQLRAAEKSKADPRGLKAARDDKKKRLIGTTEESA